MINSQWYIVMLDLINFFALFPMILFYFNCNFSSQYSIKNKFRNISLEIIIKMINLIIIISLQYSLDFIKFKTILSKISMFKLNLNMNLFTSISPCFFVHLPESHKIICRIIII
jgi:hypothetical protein